MASSQSEDHERIRLVPQSDPDSDSGEDGNTTQEDTDTTQEDKDARELEGLLKSAGYGFFHILLTVLSGIVLAADAVEVIGVGFVVPIADKDLNLTTAQKGYLDASVFVG